MVVNQRDQDLDRTVCLKMFVEGTPTTHSFAKISSIDPDGFTLEWTIPGTPASRQILVLSFAESPTVHIKGGHIKGGHIK